jgi:hypothetical protein
MCKTLEPVRRKAFAPAIAAMSQAKRTASKSAENTACLPGPRHLYCALFLKES